MNCFKAIIATISFSALFLFSDHQIFVTGSLFFLLSGFIGLGLGDIFLIKGFVELGPARTLILFAFQPIVFLFVDALILNEHIHLKNILAVTLFIICLILFALENIKKNKSWNLVGLYAAIFGIFLDGTGVYLSKKAFISTQFDGSTANFIRCLGAILFFLLLSFFRPIKLIKKFQELDKNLKFKAIIFSFIGTFLSLFFYLNAIKLGVLSVITAISVTGPVLTTIFESLIMKRKPSKTMLLCLILFLCAFSLNFTS